MALQIQLWITQWEFLFGQIITYPKDTAHIFFAPDNICLLPLSSLLTYQTQLTF